MNDIKKDHSIGEGTGAATGAITGAVVGSAAGPVGTLVGAAVGAIAGAKAGGAVAEAVNPTTYSEHFRTQYNTAPYYRAGQEWSDYAPDNTKAESRLAWNDAREAVRDGWHYIERAMPGDADRDGR